MLEKDACKLRFAEMLEVRGRMGTVSRKTTAALSRLILYPRGNESALSSRHALRRAVCRLQTAKLRRRRTSFHKNTCVFL